MQCANDLYVKYYKVADIYDKPTFTWSFIKTVDPFIWHSNCRRWATQSRAEVNDISFKAQFLLETWAGAAKHANTNDQAASNKQYWMRTSNKPSAHVIKIEPSVWPPRLSLHRSRPLPVLSNHMSNTPHMRSDKPSPSLTLPSLAAFAGDVCYKLFHSTLSCLVPPRNAISTLAAICEVIKIKEESQDQQQYTLRSVQHFVNNRRFHNDHQQYPSLGQKTRVFQSAKNAPPPAKYWKLRYHGQRPSLNMFWHALSSFHTQKGSYERQKMSTQTRTHTRRLTTSRLTVCFPVWQNLWNIRLHDVLFLLQYASMDNSLSWLQRQNLQFAQSRRTNARSLTDILCRSFTRFFVSSILSRTQSH